MPGGWALWELGPCSAPPPKGPYSHKAQPLGVYPTFMDDPMGQRGIIIFGFL